MTTEELILGHFDESLTPAEEHQLQELLGRSAEARGLYEQHGALQRMLVSDAGTLAPSSRLDDVAIAAALGTAPEMIGGGAAAGWIGGKIAAAVALVAVGGVSIALLSSSGSKPTAPVPPPTVAPAPQVVSVPPPPPSAPVTADATTVAPATATPAGEKPVTAGKLAARTNDANPRPVVRKSRRVRAQRQLRIDTNETTISHAPKPRDTEGR